MSIKHRKWAVTRSEPVDQNPPDLSLQLQETVRTMGIGGYSRLSATIGSTAVARRIGQYAPAVAATSR